MPGKTRPTPWSDVIILCRKCRKKHDGGFGDKRKESLKAALRQALGDTGWRRQVRVMETGCLGMCPKHGVTALNATRPGMLQVIPNGSNGLAALEALLDRNIVAKSDRSRERDREVVPVSDGFETT